VSHNERAKITHAHESALNNAVYHQTAGKDREALEKCKYVEFDQHIQCSDPNRKQQIRMRWPFLHSRRAVQLLTEQLTRLSLKSRLRQFGHAECKDDTDLVESCMTMENEGTRHRG